MFSLYSPKYDMKVKRKKTRGFNNLKSSSTSEASPSLCNLFQRICHYNLGRFQFMQASGQAACPATSGISNQFLISQLQQQPLRRQEVSNESKIGKILPLKNVHKKYSTEGNSLQADLCSNSFVPFQYKRIWKRISVCVLGMFGQSIPSAYPTVKLPDSKPIVWMDTGITILPTPTIHYSGKKYYK